ncbi:MAG TPA: sensor histidine kinase [Acidimicrobiales bacterium]|nr:sensor histidine kinase [Acidimicrobiales bacterium]
MPRLSTLYDRVRDPHPTVIDVMGVLCLVGIGVATEVAAPHQPGYEPSDAFSVTLSVLAPLPLLWRRPHPAAVLAITWVTMAVHGLLLYEGGGPFLALLTAVYSVAAFGSPRAARLGLAAVLLVEPVALLDPRDTPYSSWSDVAVGLLILTAVWVFGDSRRTRREQVEMIEERAVRAERERDEQARLAVREERTRIAREMHDIVAHSVSVMVVQAGAARRLVERDPHAAAEAAGQVEATGRDALREMRRAVGVLRADGEGDVTGASAPPAALEPQPALSDVPALVAGYRDAGLDVRLRTDGEPCPLPSGVELAAFRIIQEALTNTIKHAGPARAEVRIVYGPDALTVVVADDGRGAGFEPGPGGHGIVGMRERVTVYDGDLDAGPHPGGGFRVRARLPLEATAAAAEAVRL